MDSNSSTPEKSKIIESGKYIYFSLLSDLIDIFKINFCKDKSVADDILTFHFIFAWVVFGG